MKNTGTRQVINDWLMQMKPGDPGFALDEHGQCRLVSGMEADHCIVFVPSANKSLFYLFQDIWRLPDCVDAATYEGMLALSLLGVDTCGGSLGLDALTRNLVFSISGDITAMDVKSFCAMLETFLDSATHVRFRLSELLQPETGKRSSMTAPTYRLLRNKQQL
jgi:Tir chaperone protein (CesT) family